jgi:hypothetical protein
MADGGDSVQAAGKLRVLVENDTQEKPDEGTN